jgi:hypothetical protein
MTFQTPSQGRLSEARSSYQEALGIGESLTKQNPRQYEKITTMAKELLSILDKHNSPPDQP